MYVTVHPDYTQHHTWIQFKNIIENYSACCFSHINNFLVRFSSCPIRLKRRKKNNIELVYKTLTTHSHLLSDRNYVLIRYTQYLWSSAASFRAFISQIQHWKRILLSNGAIKYLCGNFSYNFVVVCDWNQIYYVYVM